MIFACFRPVFYGKTVKGMHEKTSQNLKIAKFQTAKRCDIGFNTPKLDSPSLFAPGFADHAATVRESLLGI